MSLTTKHSHQTAHQQSPWRHSFLVRLLLPILMLYGLTAFYFNNNNNDGQGRTGMDKLLNEPVMKDPIQQEEQKGMVFHAPPAAKDDPSYANTNTEGEVVAKAAKADGKAAKAEAAKGDGKAGKASTAKSKAGKSEDKKKSKAAKAEAAKGDGKAAKGTAKSKAAKAGAKGTEKSKAAKSGSAKSEKKKKSGEKKKSAKATAETIALEIEEDMEEEDVDSSMEDSM